MGVALFPITPAVDGVRSLLLDQSHPVLPCAFISYHLLARLGGLADECPANFFVFLFWRETQISKSRKNKEKQANHGLTGGSTFDHDPFPPSLPPSPLIKQYHSLNKGIGIFSRRYVIMHVGGNAVASVKLA